MFSNISWQEYWISLVVITLAYYLIIFLVYFRKGLPLRLSSQKQLSNSGLLNIDESQPTVFENSHPQFELTTAEINEPAVHACMDELNAYLENQKQNKTEKSELIFGLYTILQKYPSLRYSDYKESLTNLIATQCETICSIHLSAEELKGIWFG